MGHSFLSMKLATKTNKFKGTVIQGENCILLRSEDNSAFLWGEGPGSGP